MSGFEANKRTRDLLNNIVTSLQLWIRFRRANMR